MEQAEMKAAPSLGGWMIAAMAGLVAAAVAVVIAGFSLSQAGFVGIILLLVVGMILGMPGRALPPPMSAPVMQAAMPRPMTPPVAPVMAPPVTPPVQMTPAPLMAAPSVATPAMAAPAPLMDMPADARKPQGLSGPRGGMADELQLIEGIGPKLEELCHSLGFYHFDQIANWTADEIAWVDSNLAGFKGRVTRDKWVAQAKLILSAGREEFLRRAKTNDY